MANAFGVSEEFIDRYARQLFLVGFSIIAWLPYAKLFARELSRFIAAGRLNCKIDKVNGVVETNRPDHKNWQYQVSEGHHHYLKLQRISC
jgi:26S proteasome regulatory subunit N7